MKLSILLGVSQMSLGVILSAVNAHYERPPLRYLNLLFQFVPQILFLWCIFGYMCALILVKWGTDWGSPHHQGEDPPPMILPVIIQMFLSPGAPPPGPLFVAGQGHLQKGLLTISLLCVPVMLLVKPLVLRHLAQNPSHYHQIQEDDEENRYASRVIVAGAHHKKDEGGAHGGHGEEFEFGEVMIHQIIHTIEYVLGAISNTASYLRLWALSLAHSELSTVFWDRVLMGTLLGGSTSIPAVIKMFIAYSVWAGATIAVLLVMETLSAFLHALRLHWVEFQNKFYIGDGVRFAPFSYKQILSGEDEE